MTRRYALRDDQWERLKDLLPGRQGSVGVTAQDNRLFVEAVLYRYRRWCKQGVWLKVFTHLASDSDNEYAMIDSTIVRALYSQCRGQGGDAEAQAIGRSKGGLKARHLIENFFAHLKQYRAIATRYDKLAESFLSGIYLAATVIWLN